jgi:glucokinase
VRSSGTGATEGSVIAVDVGGTKVLAGLVTSEGDVSATIRLPTPSSGGAALLQTVHEAVRSVRAAAADARAPVLGCGVGTAGVVLDDRIVSANDLLPGWADMPLAESLSSLLDRPVAVVNDVHAAATAEVRLGAARGMRAALVVAVGTGIGGALVQDGRVVAGRQGIAGSIGHMPAPITAHRVCSCGVIGHIEAYSGGRAIEQDYRHRHGRDLDLHRIAELAVSGDHEAARAIHEGGYLLGRVLGGASTLIDPDLVVLGGGVSSIGELFVGAVRRGMAAEEIRPGAAPRLVPGALGVNSVLIGSALTLFERERGDGMTTKSTILRRP